MQEKGRVRSLCRSYGPGLKLESQQNSLARIQWYALPNLECGLAQWLVRQWNVLEHLDNICHITRWGMSPSNTLDHGRPDISSNASKGIDLLLCEIFRFIHEYLELLENYFYQVFIWVTLNNMLWWKEPLRRVPLSWVLTSTFHSPGVCLACRCV